MSHLIRIEHLKVRIEAQRQGIAQSQNNVIAAKAELLAQQKNLTSLLKSLNLAIDEEQERFYSTKEKK